MFSRLNTLCTHLVWMRMAAVAKMLYTALVKNQFYNLSAGYKIQEKIFSEPKKAKYI